MPQLVPTAPRERALPLSSSDDPHIYNPPATPHPPATETSSSLGAEAWTSPSPLLLLVRVLRRAGAVTVPLRGLLLSCYPTITALSRGWGRGPVKVGVGGGGGGVGRRHLRCSHKAATVGTLTEASVIPLPSHTHLLSEGPDSFHLPPSVSARCCLSELSWHYRAVLGSPPKKSHKLYPCPSASGPSFQVHRS